MTPIDPGDVARILRNKRIASSLFGAGVGSMGGYLLGDQTGWYDPWKGALAGGLAGAGLGAILPRKAYNLDEIQANANKIVPVPSASGSLVESDGYWISPGIGGALLGTAATAAVTDDPYKISIAGMGGLIGGRLADGRMLKNTKFPTIL